MELTEITDNDALCCAKLIGIESDFTIERFNEKQRDCGGIRIKGKSGKSNYILIIYFNNSNKRIYLNGFEVIDFCWEIYDYLTSKGYVINRRSRQKL